MDPDWTASALFSPSKARAQQAQAKDWAAVDSWLVKRYGSRLPTFERNEDTLQALLSLATLNDSADEQRSQVERIERTAYNAITKRHSAVADEIMPTMLAELASETHLDTLAEAFVVSDCASSDMTLLAGKIIQLTTSEFEATQQLKRAEAQIETLKKEQDHSQKLLDALKGDDFQMPADMVETTAEWQKTTKHLKAKIAEYEERLASMRPVTATYSIERIQSQSEDLSRQRRLLSGLEAQLKAYQDLPTDAKAARRQVEAAREELRRLTVQRDEAFERMAK